MNGVAFSKSWTYPRKDLYVTETLGIREGLAVTIVSVRMQRCSILYRLRTERQKIPTASDMSGYLQLDWAWREGWFKTEGLDTSTTYQAHQYVKRYS